MRLFSRCNSSSKTAKLALSMHRPFFSVVIPTYNRAEDLKFALFCILRQNFKDFEIIICDNASTDQTVNIPNLIQSKKIKYFRNEKNIGVKQNIKKAIKKARGSYIFLHSDDDFIIETRTLDKIRKVINRTRPGFIRLNYIVRTPGKKNVFNFHWKTPPSKDLYLPKNSSSLDILNFIFDTDSGFVTGLIFKNDLPPNVTILNTDPLPWIAVLYESSVKGAYFIAKPGIVASWSGWRADVSGSLHPTFSLQNGKLMSEKYLSFVKSKLNKELYTQYKSWYLFTLYVKMFPAIKLYTSQSNLKKISARILSFEPSLQKKYKYRIYLKISLLLPKPFLKILRRIFLFWSTIYLKRDHDNRYLIEINKIEKEFNNQINKKTSYA